MNAAGQFRGHKVDIRIDRSIIYRDVFYGNEISASSSFQKGRVFLFRVLKQIGRIAFLPFRCFGKAVLSFGSPKDPRAFSSAMEPSVEVPYYRPVMRPSHTFPMVAMSGVSIPASVGMAIRKKRRTENRQTVLFATGAVADPFLLPGDILKRIPAGERLFPKKRAERQSPLEKHLVGAGTDHRRRRFFWRWLFRIMGIALVCSGMAGMMYQHWYQTEGRYMMVVVNDGTNSIQVRTLDGTAEELLAAQGLALEERDLINVDVQSPLTEGLVMNITRAKEIEVIKGNNAQTVKMAEGTVADTLSYAGVTYREGQDEVYPSLDTPIGEVEEIRVITVDTDYRITTEALPFETTYKETSSLIKGATAVSTPGKQGVRTIKTQLIYRDGVVVEEKEISSVITQNPTTQVVLRGTKVLDTGKDYRKGTAPPDGSTIKGTLHVDRLTAYTYTGNNTSTGRKPAVGLCAVNPKQIPYGTKMYIPGYGYAVAADTGGFVNWGGTQIDLFMETESDCRIWGVKRNRIIYIIK